MKAVLQVCNRNGSEGPLNEPPSATRASRLTQHQSHLLHDVGGDVGGGGVAQDLHILEGDVILQLLGVDAFIIDMRIEDADEYEETQEQKREDELL